MTLSLGALKARALRAIDQAAGRARLRCITDIPGQPGVYARKLKQAEDYLGSFVGGEPTAEPGAYLVAEAAELGVSAATLAEGIVAKSAACNSTVDPAIEAARVGGKARIRAAESEAQMLESQASAIAALEAI